MKKLIKDLGPYLHLYRDDRTGIAWVEDGTTGMWHTCHPNIDTTGSVRGMKKLGYWREDARTVRCCGFIYNVDSVVVTDELDRVAAGACQCQSCIERRATTGC